jgi:hypothetical protein
MNAEVFAEWLRRQGHRVMRTPSSYWFDQGPRVYQAFPYHQTIEPAEEELREFLYEQNAIGLRYSTPWSAHLGNISYHAIFEGPSYSLENLDRRSRQNIRKGMGRCTVEPISLQRLADEGWALELDTLERQGRQPNTSRKAWEKRCLSAAGLPGFEAWGAMVDGKLGASMLAFQMGDCCYLLYKQCFRHYLPLRVNNALSFVVTETLAGRPSIRSILYGLHSLDAPPGVDEFKFRMGYSAKPVRQRVVFHPLLAPFFNRTTHALVKRLLKRYPENARLSKTEGMMRFYLEGREPIERQHWPEVLLKQQSVPSK